MWLNALLDPNVDYVVLALAFVLTVMALFAPGTGVLEVAALIALSAVGFSIARIPVNAWAIPALLAGVVMVIVAIKRDVKWYFLVSAILIILGSSAFLFSSSDRVFSAEPLLVLVVSVSLGGFIWIIGRNAGKAYKQTTRQDLDSTVGKTGRAVTAIHHSGTAMIAGQEWSAKSDSLIKPASQVRVTGREGLVLRVEKID